jgi:hypothetical protein
MSQEALIDGWPALRDLARALGLPEVVEATSWGEPCLKAFGKNWTWWSPSEQCSVFKVDFDEREFLLEHRTDTFFITDHYRSHRLVLMRRQAFDAAWARANLVRVWRAQAPKRFLKLWDANQQESPSRPVSMEM